MVARIKMNDTVVVLTGKNKGQQSSVIGLLPKKNKVIVKDVAVVTKHLKARKAGQPSGIKKIETAINISNVMPLCPSCKKPCRIAMQTTDEGDRVRACHDCKNIF